jgi:uncharacterized protein (UPF0261 family)
VIDKHAAVIPNHAINYIDLEVARFDDSSAVTVLVRNLMTIVDKFTKNQARTITQAGWEVKKNDFTKELRTNFKKRGT